LKSTAILLVGIIGVMVRVLPAWANPKADDRPAEAFAEYMYGMPDGLDGEHLEELVDSPRLVGMKYYIFNDIASGERRVGGYAEVIAVYDAPIQHLVEAAIDFEGYPRFVPRILDARLDSSDGTRYRLWYDSGIRLLGFEISFRIKAESVIERLEGGAVGVRSRMLESIDGGLYEHFNSFYMEPLVIDGRPMTFVRYFNRPGIRKPTPGTLQIVRLFSPSEAKAQVSSIGREAIRRIQDR
jgi:hypothetical protein